MPKDLPKYIKTKTSTLHDEVYMKQYLNGYLVCSTTSLLFYFMSGIPAQYEIVNEAEATQVFNSVTTKLNEILNI